jgi:DNA-binding transcriptional LysR family regulator
VSLELRQLRYFLAVAEELNFTRAADRLVMTQQPLSAAIKQLESQLGVQLFERTTRKVELTPAGEALLGEARELLARADAATERVQRAAVDRTSLLVGVSSAAYGERASATLAALRERHPEIRLEVRSFEVTAPSAGVADGVTDVAIVREPVVAEWVETETIGLEARVFVLAAGTRLAARDSLSVAEAAAEPWIAAKPALDGCDPHAWRDFWLANPRPDGRPPVVGIEVATIDEWREHAAAGTGISLCPRSAETYYARPGLAFVPAPDAAPARLAIAWRRGARELAEPLLAASQRALARARSV